MDTLQVSSKLIVTISKSNGLAIHKRKAKGTIFDQKLIKLTENGQILKPTKLFGSNNQSIFYFIEKSYKAIFLFDCAQ